MNISCSHPWSMLVAAACGLSVGCLLQKRHGGPRLLTTLGQLGQLGQLGLRVEPDVARPAAHRAGQPAGVRVCIVTGGSRGIGAAVCERLAKEGYRVAVNFQTNRERAEDVVRKIRAAGGSALAVQADVSEPAEVKALFVAAEESLGKVTAVVNNAAVLGPFTGLLDSDPGEAQRVMRTNLWGCFSVLREAAERMATDRGGRGGCVVNLGAGSAFTGTPLLYAMSKGALNSLSAGSCEELALQGIRVNTVSPGPTFSDMMQGFDEASISEMAAQLPMRRPGEASEVAAAVCWLLSDDASFVAGANLRVAGGKRLEA